MPGFKSAHTHFPHFAVEGSSKWQTVGCLGHAYAGIIFPIMNQTVRENAVKTESDVYRK